MNNIISKQAEIGLHLEIGNNVIIYDNVKIGNNCYIGDNCIIGLPYKGKLKNKLLIIGDNSIVRSHTVIYEGSNLGRNLETGHHSIIRENTTAGINFRIGSFCDVEGDCQIGDYLRCHSYVHIGKGAKIGNFVWIFSLVTLTNDPLPPSHIHSPVLLEDGVVVCVGCTLLPGSVMKMGSFAASNTVVRGIIPPAKVVSGASSKILGSVKNLYNLENKISHPWMNHFADNYPLECQDLLNILKLKILNI